MKVKELSEVKKKYADAATFVPTRYKDATAKVTDWKEKAASATAEELWKAKIAEAAAAERRRKAIERVSNEDWRSKTQTLGAARIGPGMAANVDKHNKEWAPYREALVGTELPPRTADPLTNIDNRVKGVVSVLVAKKKELKG